VRIEKQKLFSLILAIVVFTTFFTVPAAAIDNNIFANYDPSFEASTFGKEMIRSTADKVTGNSCGYIGPGVYSQRFFPATLTPDTTYILSVWVKTTGASNNGQIRLNYKDGSNNNSLSALISITGAATPFKLYSLEFTTPSQLGTLDTFNQFSVSFYGGTEFYVDDIKLIDKNSSVDQPFFGTFKNKTINPTTKSIVFTSSVAATDFKAYINSSLLPLTVKNVGLEFTIEFDISDYNSGDSFEITAFYNGTIGIVDGVNYVGGSDVIKPYILADAPEIIDTSTPIPPVINIVNDSSLTITGKADCDGFVTVLIGKTIEETLAENGEWTVELTKPLIAGTIISATIEFDELLSGKRVRTVIPRTPTVASIKTNSTYVKGSATIYSVVYAKIGAKIYSSKASSKGIFNIKIPKIKKGATVSVRSKARGQFSLSKVIKAK